MKIRTVQDELPGTDRTRWVSTRQAQGNAICNQVIRNRDGSVERKPSRAAPTRAGIGLPTVDEISHRNWYIDAISPQGHLVAFVMTNGSAELMAENVWERGSYESWRWNKIRVGGWVPVIGKPLAALINEGIVDPRSLLSRAELRKDPCTCEPSPEMCPCIAHERDLRQSRFAAGELQREADHHRAAAASDVRVARASAEAMADALGPVVEKLADAATKIESRNRRGKVEP